MSQIKEAIKLFEKSRNRVEPRASTEFWMPVDTVLFNQALALLRSLAEERKLILQENTRLSQQAKEYFSEAAQAREALQKLRKDIVSQAAELKEKQDAE